MNAPAASAPLPPSRVELALATMGYAGLTLLWTAPPLLAFLMPPWAGVGVVALVVAVFAWWYTPPGAGSRALHQRKRFRARPWIRGRGRVAALAGLMIPLQVSLITLLMALGWTDGEELPPFMTDYLARPGGWVMLAMLVVVAAPIMEEVFFRGRIQGMLERRLGPVVGIAVTAALFALIHFQVEGLPNRFVGGVVLGVAVFATRTVWAGVALHAAWNAGVSVLAAVFPDVDPFGKGVTWALPAAAVLVLSAAATVWVARGLLAECRGRRPPPPRPTTRAAAPLLVAGEAG